MEIENHKEEVPFAHYEVLFRALNKAQYLELVQGMARQAGLTTAPAELEKLAVQWEREHASRTPRSAHQFIRYLQGI